MFNKVLNTPLTLREKCPYLECFWSVFACIQTEYGEIRLNTDQTKSEYGHFLRSENQVLWLVTCFYTPSNNFKKHLFKRNTNLCMVWITKASVGKCSLRKLSWKISQYHSNTTCTGIHFKQRRKSNPATLIKKYSILDHGIKNIL